MTSDCRVPQGSSVLVLLLVLTNGGTEAQERFPIISNARQFLTNLFRGNGGNEGDFPPPREGGFASRPLGLLRPPPPTDEILLDVDFNEIGGGDFLLPPPPNGRPIILPPSRPPPQQLEVSGSVPARQRLPENVVNPKMEFGGFFPLPISTSQPLPDEYRFEVLNKHLFEKDQEVEAEGKHAPASLLLPTPRPPRDIRFTVAPLPKAFFKKGEIPSDCKVTDTFCPVGENYPR